MILASAKQSDPQLASWWEVEERAWIRCILCPRYCSLPEGSRGFCYLRQNVQGQLITHGYGMAVGLNADPIEKKPLYHFYPGSLILSFGALGCNLGCKFCQNWHMSKVAGQFRERSSYTPKELVQLALDNSCIGIAYTYNEPIIFGEWVRDVAREARFVGLKNVLVTNGYVTSQAREEVFEYIDAANVDLKSMTNTFYRKLTLSQIEPVLETLRWLCHETDVWLEITTLLIPGENDTEREIRELTKFIAQELNPQIPLHFSAFHPDFKLQHRPPTPLSTLVEAHRIARESGLEFVYLGNVLTEIGQDTVCPSCEKVLIHRLGWRVEMEANFTGKCLSCEKELPGRFDYKPHPTGKLVRDRL